MDYDYDGYGRLTGIAGPTGTVAYTYDDLDNLLTATTDYNGASAPAAKTLTYAYNADGSRASLNAAGNTFTYQYDAIGRMRQLTNPQSEVSKWEYQDNGWLSLQTLNHGTYALKTRYAYNRRGFLTSLRHLNNAESYAYSQFTSLAYDAIGDTTSLTAGFGIYQSGMAPRAPGLTYYNGTTTYLYNKIVPSDTDAFGLLRSEQTSRFTNGYTKTHVYDGSGNPTTLRSTSGIPYNVDNQRTGTGYGYDGNGNQTSRSSITLSYDGENRLTQYGSSTQITSAYDALGLRVKKTVGSTVTWYLYDGAIPVLELNNDGTVTAVNTFGPNGLISRRVGTTTSFYTFDPLGNAANVINATGAVLYNCGYDAYGQPYGNATMLTYGYGAQYGYYRDTEAAYADNLLLCTFRWYDPTTARWLTRDPIGYAGGSNLYGYVDGDPVGWLDAMGLAPLLKWGLHPYASDALRDAGVGSSRIVQTIGDATASSGFHHSDGTFGGKSYCAATDLSVRGLSSKEAQKLADTLGAQGFAAFLRWEGWEGNRHIHAVFAGIPMKPGLSRQVDDYLWDKNGLRGHGPDRCKHPRRSRWNVAIRQYPQVLGLRERWGLGRYRGKWGLL